jgi:hypothetical protein
MPNRYKKCGLYEENNEITALGTSNPLFFNESRKYVGDFFNSFLWYAKTFQQGYYIARSIKESEKETTVLRPKSCCLSLEPKCVEAQSTGIFTDTTMITTYHESK